VENRTLEGNIAAVPAFIEIIALDRVQPAGAGPDRSEREPAQRNLDDDLRAIERVGMSSFRGGSAAAITGGSAAALTGGIVCAGAGLGAGAVGTMAAGAALAVIVGLGGGVCVVGIGVATIGVGALLYAAIKENKADKKKKEQ